MGFSLVFSVLRIINFSYGSIFMLGAFVGLTVLGLVGKSFLAAFLAVVVVLGFVGVLVERLVVRPLREKGAPPFLALVSTLGASIFLQAAAEVIWGAEVRGYPILFPQQFYTVAGARISFTEVVTLLFAIGLMVGLQAYVKWGKMGKAMRAVAQDTQAAALMGVNVNQVITFVFAVGSAMGAAGGLLTGTYYGYAQPAMGFMVGLKGFIAAIVGGMGSVAGAGLGGFLIGMTEALGGAYISFDYKEVILFSVLLLVLLIRPSGILGHSIREKV